MNSFLIEIGGFDDQGDEHPASANVLPRAATLCHDLGREYGPVILQLNCKRVDISLPVLEPWVPTRGYPGASPLLSTISNKVSSAGVTAIRSSAQPGTYTPRRS